MRGNGRRVASAARTCTGARMRSRATGLIALSLLFLLVLAFFGQQATPSLSLPPLRVFPSVADSTIVTSSTIVTDSTILFLHVFKCGGTSLRQVFMSLAKANGWSGAIVQECKAQKVFQFHDPPGGNICITHENQIVDKARGKWLVGGTKVLAGHFLWDFRTYVTQPYLLITTLRNPLELIVSAMQFKHRDETRTLGTATSFVEGIMRDRLTWEDPTRLGFIRRFVDNDAANSAAAPSAFVPALAGGQDEYLAMVRAAVEHLSTFFVVGVVEQYEGFMHVLRRTMDPGLEHPSLWEDAVKIRNNGSPVQSKDVLSRIDEDIVRRFNDSVLHYEWKVYEIALQLWDTRCRQVLPVSDHDSLCTVPGYS